MGPAGRLPWFPELDLAQFPASAGRKQAFPLPCLLLISSWEQCVYRSYWVSEGFQATQSENKEKG